MPLWRFLHPVLACARGCRWCGDHWAAFVFAPRPASFVLLLLHLEIQKEAPPGDARGRELVAAGRNLQLLLRVVPLCRIAGQPRGRGAPPASRPGARQRVVTTDCGHQDEDIDTQ
ncbi:hypothetical protein MRX96_044447 [Rhipicephalus microplus]